MSPVSSPAFLPGNALYELSNNYSYGHFKLAKVISFTTLLFVSGREDKMKPSEDGTIASDNKKR